MKNNIWKKNGEKREKRLEEHHQQPMKVIQDKSFNKQEQLEKQKANTGMLKFDVLKTNITVSIKG